MFISDQILRVKILVRNLFPQNNLLAIHNMQILEPSSVPHRCVSLLQVFRTASSYSIRKFAFQKLKSVTIYCQYMPNALLVN